MIGTWSQRRKADKCNQCGATALDGEDLDLARSWFDEALRLDPRHGPAYLARGLVRLKQADYPGAVADLSAAIRLDPTEARAFYFRGLAHRGLGRPSQAATDEAAAVRLDPAVARRVGDPRPTTPRMWPAFLAARAY